MPAASQETVEERYGPGSIFVRRFEMPAGRTFDRHRHDSHQLLWAPSGLLTVQTDGGAWLLPPDRALWVPAGVAHTTAAARRGVLQGCYFAVAGSCIAWTEPTVVGVTPLLRELIGHLARSGADLSGPAKRRAEGVVFDLLVPEDAVTIDVPLPTDPRARAVADRLIADPGDGRSLDQWGRVVGASGRTLTRLFVAEVGMGFGLWRTRLRARAALALLAAGTPVTVVAREVGYRTPSAFGAAFRQVTGQTPGTFLR